MDRSRRGSATHPQKSFQGRFTKSVQTRSVLLRPGKEFHTIEDDWKDKRSPEIEQKVMCV
eukprot:12321500-Karenia_brevis.AAC.1